MKQALKLYALIKKDQMILAFILGIVLTGLEVGSSLWQNKLSDTVNSGVILTGGWLLVAFVSLLMDQSRRLDVWLYTQKISRGQLFITRVLLMVILPIVVGIVINSIVLAIINPSDLMNAMVTTINVSMGYFFLSSLVAVIYTVIGPNWMKVAGVLFTAIVMVGPLDAIEANWQGMWSLNLTIVLILSLIVFSISYVLAKKISAETTDDAVRLRYLRWPIVIFVFVAMELTILSNHVGPLDIKAIVSTLLEPTILAGITFVFVFRPKLKMTWDK